MSRVRMADGRGHGGGLNHFATKGTRFTEERGIFTHDEGKNQGDSYKLEQPIEKDQSENCKKL